MQHHLHSIRQTPCHPENIWRVEPGSKTIVGWWFPVVHGWPAPPLHLCGSQSQVCCPPLTPTPTVISQCSYQWDLNMLRFHCSAPQDQEPGSWGQSDRRSDGPKCSAWRDGTNVHNTEGAPTPPQLFLWQPILYIMLYYVVIYTYVHAGMLYPDPAWVNYIGGGRRTPQNHQQDLEITEARTNQPSTGKLQRGCAHRERREGGEGRG